jgi:hypothetical protein
VGQRGHFTGILRARFWDRAWCSKRPCALTLSMGIYVTPTSSPILHGVYVTRRGLGHEFPPGHGYHSLEEDGMDKKTLYETSTKMESAGVDPAYVLGWQSGFLHNPKLEEQRVTEAYDAGYNDGLAGKTDGYSAWAKQ